MNRWDYLGLEGFTDYFEGAGPGFFDPNSNLSHGINGDDVRELEDLIAKINEIKDSEGRPCYIVILRTESLNADGFKAWGLGFDQAILNAHTSGTTAQTGDEEVDFGDLQPNCTIYGCHLDEDDGVVPELEILQMIKNRLNSLKAKDCCLKPETIGVAAGQR